MSKQEEQWKLTRSSKKKEETIGELKHKYTGSKKCDCPFELLGMKFE